MIRNKRNTLKLYRKYKNEEGIADSTIFIRDFLGRIDKGTTSTGFQDGKTTTLTAPRLFCDIDEEFISNDLVQDINGQRYVIVAGEQPDGVSGITPVSFNAHKEIVLEKVNG